MQQTGVMGADLQWNHSSEPKRKRLKEQDILENNSQISPVDFLQQRPVSTGLCLSLDNTRIATSADSTLISFISDGIDSELRCQDAEIDRFLKHQQAIQEKVQANQLQTISLVEDKVFQKLCEKEAEVEDINKRNFELEERMEQLTVDLGAWQQWVRCYLLSIFVFVKIVKVSLVFVPCQSFNLIGMEVYM